MREQARSASAEPEEILDRLDLPLDETRTALRDLERVTLWSIGRRALRTTLLPRLYAMPRPVHTVLDVAAGAGDSTAALQRSAGGRGVALEVISLDRKLSHLVVGRSQGYIQRPVVGLAESLPFGERCFDWAVSSLFFHHLDDERKQGVGREMRRVSRQGAVVVDLRRSRWAAWVLRGLSPILGLGQVALRDGIVSVARSWTIREWRVFLSGQRFELRRRFPARLSVVLPPLPSRD